MSGIRSKNTKPEMRIRKALYARGYRYRLHSTKVYGKPDIIMKKHNAIIFIHGCFWHGHSCSLFRLPKTRTEFWETKIEGNRERDSKVRSRLREEGWRVATVWEYAMRGKGKMDFEELIDKLTEWIDSDKETLMLSGGTV